MPDYGHDLVFGSFLTPGSDQPEAVVGLARLSEQLGLDLVTFQDHPYQPGHLDTWTLMSYVAAATVDISIAPNVLNLPLRPPAVVGQAAASLDRLSGGRFELGLGAGAFWDAIEAMGGGRRTPGQAVEALEEAIAILRQQWDSDARGGVRVTGTHYSVAGAKRGPAPVHPISIWLGAYKPRMLRVTGRLADGWLPSSGYLPPDGLAPANTTIDEAATAAGRDPSEIRRLYNIAGSFDGRGSDFLTGSPGVWAEQLSELALEHGISAFILGSDDAAMLTRFAAEVAPAVRELVAAGRATPAPIESRSPAPARSGAEPQPAAERQPKRPTARLTHSSFTVTPTPDDGHRLSSHRLWDESQRPDGPAPDPERAYTPHDLASGQHLIDIHDHLRSELTQIRELVAQVLGGSLSAGAARSHINEMTMRQNLWTVGAYCSAYCRVVTTHHSIEDQAMFPRLRQADPRLTDVVDRLAYEHTVIHEVLEGVDHALVRFVGAEADAAGLQRAVDVLTDTLLSHLSYEERELVEPIARLGVLV